LVLVCHDCRSKVRIWGEDVNVSVADNASDHSVESHESQSCRKLKPDLYCGGVEKQCINEGNEVQHCELRQY
jgi:hypothetical protein